jgi:hypothetical protein
LSFGWPSSFFVGAASFFAAASFFGAGLVFVFLSSLAIVFPNADLSDQVELPLKFHPTAM